MKTIIIFIHISVYNVNYDQELCLYITWIYSFNLFWLYNTIPIYSTYSYVVETTKRCEKVWKTSISQTVCVSEHHPETVSNQQPQQCRNVIKIKRNMYNIQHPPFTCSISIYFILHLHAYIHVNNIRYLFLTILLIFHAQASCSSSINFLNLINTCIRYYIHAWILPTNSQPIPHYITILFFSPSA